MYTYSPLRYPGGKGKLAKCFMRIFKENSLCDGYYVEPYAGGGAVALALLFNEYASKVVINDIDRSIYAFWYSVLNKTEQLCKLIRDTPVTIEVWREQKTIQSKKARAGLLKLGFSTFFLNRTNRSGILSAGVIGGMEQSGDWKMDARFNKKELIKRIERVACYRNRIELYNHDAIRLVRELSGILPKKSLFYFDPPYYKKGKALYLNYYDDSDHAEVAKSITKIKKQKWIVTYDSVPSIRKIYADYRKISYKLSYSAAEAKTGSEVMILSKNVVCGSVY